MILRLKSKAKKLSTTALVLGVMEITLPSRSVAVELPQASSVWVTSGVATRATSANTLTINQTSDKAIFNWTSFNISADGHVIFNQPSSSAVALNRIQQADPSRIFGELRANGQLYLINQNGFVFGSTARVNTGGLIASTLNMSDDVFNNGLLSANTTSPPTAALSTLGNTATIEVQPGAKLTTNDANQRILLAANKINNAGDITANDGQVILAAGDSVYVNASSDPQLRGLLVEVSGGNADSGVLNTGTVTSERGNITAVGLAINQNGRMTATTSVNVNGSIRLLARINATATTDETGANTWTARSGGTLTLDQGSVTEVNPDTVDTSTAIDEQTQLQSTIEMSGKSVTFNNGSTVRASGGTLSVVAATDLTLSRNDNTTVDTGASITVADGALIDLSGSVANTSVTRNLVSVELRANELADSPLQRDGVLRGKTVTVDARVGTSLADVSGAIALIKKDVFERTSNGGSVVFDTAGRIAVKEGATIDVSGGAVNYAGGMMQTTKLIKSDGTVVDIGSASKDVLYAGMLSPTYKYVSDRWGVTKVISTPSTGKYEAGYTEGANAGSVQFMGTSLALNGQFLGHATAGERQRTTDTLPKGGQFIIGATRDSDGKVPTYWRAPDLTLTRNAMSSALAAGTTQISTDFIDHGGFTRVQLASDQGVTIAADTALDLGPGGSLSLNAQRIAINSNVTAHGGSIAADTSLSANAGLLNNTGISVADGVTLDVSGRWTNDARVPAGQSPSDAIVLKGGSITLKQTTAAGTLDIGNDVSLLADGGAWVKQSGSIVGGAGGKISLVQDGSAIQSGTTQTLKIGERLQLSGYGAQGAAGGSFTLRAPRLNVSNSAESLGAQQAVGTFTGGDAVNVGTSLFSGHGFATFALQADSFSNSGSGTAADLSVASGTQINLLPATHWIDSSALNLSTGAAVATIAKTVVLPEYLSKSASLTLSSSALGHNNDLLAFTGVNVAEGAVITATPGSTINLNANGNVNFSGEIHAAGGNVFMQVNQGVEDKAGFVDRQLVIGNRALIDVAGKTTYTPNDLGLKQGTVRDGGSVSLVNNRGSINVQAGSVIDISGTQAQLDVLPLGSKGYQQVDIASQGGSLSVNAEESIALQGELRAHGGMINGTENDGGSLSITLNRQSVVQVATGATAFPTNNRRIELVAHGDAAPANGVASVGADFIANSGVDSLALAATGEIDVAAGVNLSLQRSLTLETPAIGVIGSGKAQLSASTVIAGSGAVTASNYVPSLTAGTGTLTLQADYLNLQNILGFTRVAQVNLISQGDIALTNSFAGGLTNNGNNLITSGDVLFQSTRMLPTTGSVYRIDATTTLKDANNQSVAARNIVFAQQGASSGVPLSAAGELSVTANNITQGGSLYAPFGKITLNATNTLKLPGGSITSVSGEDTLIPYGRVDNGSTWVWGTASASTSEVTASPQGAVTLNGNTVEMSSGSVVNVSGGGDLLAYQFTPGTGGKQDVLDPTSSGYLKNTYVIMPASAAGSIPYDPMMWDGSGLTSRQSIYLAAGSGVPAGVYQLLPLRYALTPGAYMVSALSNYQDLPAGKTATLVDGATVVSGYYTFGAQQNAAARTSGFAVRPGSYARTLAQYDDYLASDFFAAQADKAGTTALLTSDAGTLTVAVNSSLTALGDVLTQGKTHAGKRGRNAQVDVTTNGNVLEIDASTPTTGTTGAVHVSSAILSNWQAGSLLLGGSRDATGAVNVKASDVTLHTGSSISADEVVLAAARNLTVESGAKVASRSGNDASVALDDAQLAQASTLTLTGSNAAKAAVLAVSDHRYLVANRDLARNSAQAGAVNVQSGAEITTRGALLLDAAGSVIIADHSVDANGASWALGASNVSLGGNAVSNTLTINDSLQQELTSARAITLSSEHDLTLKQAATFGNSTTRSLTLQADRIVNAASGANSTFNAKTVTLSGINAQSGALTAGTGTLSFNAEEIQIGKNQIGISGFRTTNLNSNGLISATSNGGVNVAGDINVTSTAMTATSGAVGSIYATGTMQLQQASGAAPAAHSLNTGGELSFAAQNIVDSARILMPSGVVTLQATNSLSLGDTAVIDASGYQPELATSGSNGGYINLKSGGDTTLASGAVLNVSAGPKANAGLISIDATGNATLKGQYLGTAGSAGEGGQFVLHAKSLSDFATLNQTLEQGGFTETRSIHVDTGDLTLAKDQTMTARQIELDADNGVITINGALIARSTDRRSHIEVNAGNNVVIGASAVLDVDADDATNHKAGDILLNSNHGKLQLASTATIRAHGKDSSGSLTLRAAATGNNFNNLESLPTDLRLVDAVVLEPVKRGGIYTLSDGFLDASQFDAMRADLSSYVTAAASSTRTRLGLTSATNVAFRPYADVTYNGDLVVDSYDFNAANWHFDGTNAATVSIRSTGTLELAGTLSDGFVDQGAGLELSAETHSVGFNLVAGADLNAASNHATQRNNAADLKLDDYAVVRTGTGNINLTAAHDVTVGALASVYTGGVRSRSSFTDFGSNISFAERGGSVSVTAGRDVVGNVSSNYTPTDWHIRWAPYKSDFSGLTSKAYWGVDYNFYDWNFGALGGGDVIVQASRDVNDASIAVVDSMANKAGVRTALGGGNLEINAARNINTGYFYASKGRGDLNAGGAFNATGSRMQNGRALGTFLLAGDTSYRLNATRDVLFEGEVQASLINPVNAFADEQYIYYSRYGESSLLELVSAGGDVKFNTGNSAVVGPYGFFDTSDVVAPYAASMRVMSFGNDVSMGGAFMMTPSASGNLEMYAFHDVLGNSNQITMSDSNRSTAGLSAENVAFDGAAGVAAVINTNNSMVLHSADADSSSISAGNDIAGVNLVLAEATKVQAGRDITNLKLDVQQSGAATTTQVIAGRDVTYDLNDGLIYVAGSGVLEVMAGRDVDLGLTSGIATTGRLLNGNLPDKPGADVVVMAGLSQPLDVSGFMTNIVGLNESLKAGLITFVESVTQQSGLDYALASTTFQTMSDVEQRQFALSALFAELVASGAEANNGKGYERGFAAIKSLFPKSQDSDSPYKGDISLPFSRVYTQDGGNITLVAPGGKLDVGLANAPSIKKISDYLTSKKPSELGIVAQGTGDVHVLTQGDVLVNSSRIFTLGGGDIDIWSSAGNIDAGKGAKSSLSAPPPTISVDAQGNVVVSFGAAIAGSGIRTIQVSDDIKPGDVNLLAPAGFVNAGDAGIGSSGNLTIAAQRVVGLDNIQVGGSSSGVPAETSGLGASLSGVSSTASGAANSASNSAATQAANNQNKAPLAETALSWLEVFVVGLGEDNCKQDDLECLKRQSTK